MLSLADETAGWLGHVSHPCASGYWSLQAQPAALVDERAHRWVWEAEPRAAASPTPATESAAFSALVGGLLRLHSTKPDWNGLGSAPPTYDAIARAISVLWALRATHLQPTRVTPSAEGGVAVTFRKGGRFASVESLNSGEIVLLTSDGTGNPRAWAIDSSDDALRQAAKDLREYFEH
jgi:hypothetical protein